MDKTEIPNSDRIMLTALQLMKDKGFKSVTVKDIAQASEVSHMTVFRYYETKKSILEAAIKRYSYLPSFEKVFNEKIIFDLEQDLQLIARTYFELMENNQPIFLIAVQERKTMPELASFISDHTKQLKEYIKEYFVTMQEKNQMMKADASAQALIFLTMLYGYFSSNALWDTLFVHESRDEYIRTSVMTFCNGIKSNYFVK